MQKKTRTGKWIIWVSLIPAGILTYVPAVALALLDRGGIAVLKSLLMLNALLFGIASLSNGVRQVKFDKKPLSYLQPLLCGAVLLLAAAFQFIPIPPFPSKYFNAGLFFTAGLVLFFPWMFWASGIANLIYRCRKRPAKLSTLIVLGCGLKKEKPSKELMRRIHHAEKTYRSQTPPPRLILCGGATSGTEITEVAVMANCLQELGIPAESMLLEDASLTTMENFRNAKQYLSENDLNTTAFLTSDYHLYRASLCAEAAGLFLPGIGCKTPMRKNLRGPALTREALAWVSRLKLLFFLYCIPFVILSILILM